MITNEAKQKWVTAATEFLRERNPTPELTELRDMGLPWLKSLPLQDPRNPFYILGGGEEK